MHKAEYITRKVLAMILIISILFASTSGIGESDDVTYEQIKETVFNTMADDERVFKNPDGGEYFYTKDMQFPCKGSVLLTIPGMKDGK